MPRGKGGQDPIGNYIEWTHHRYDPGHYLGGTIKPELRKSSLGPRATRLSGMLLLGSGLGGLVLTAFAGYSDGPGAALGFGLYAGLLVAAGVSMWRSSSPRRGGSTSRGK